MEAALASGSSIGSRHRSHHGKKSHSASIYISRRPSWDISRARRPIPTTISCVDPKEDPLLILRALIFDGTMWSTYLNTRKELSLEQFYKKFVNNKNRGEGKLFYYWIKIIGQVRVLRKDVEDLNILCTYLKATGVVEKYQNTCENEKNTKRWKAEGAWLQENKNIGLNDVLGWHSFLLKVVVLRLKKLYQYYIPFLHDLTEASHNIITSRLTKSNLSSYARVLSGDFSLNDMSFSEDELKKSMSEVLWDLVNNQKVPPPTNGKNLDLGKKLPSRPPEIAYNPPNAILKHGKGKETCVMLKKYAEKDACTGVCEENPCKPGHCLKYKYCDVEIKPNCPVNNPCIPKCPIESHDGGKGLTYQHGGSADGVDEEKKFMGMKMEHPLRDERVVANLTALLCNYAKEVEDVLGVSIELDASRVAVDVDRYNRKAEPHMLDEKKGLGPCEHDANKRIGHDWYQLKRSIDKFGKFKLHQTMIYRLLNDTFGHFNIFALYFENDLKKKSSEYYKRIQGYLESRRLFELSTVSLDNEDPSGMLDEGGAIEQSTVQKMLLKDARKMQRYLKVLYPKTLKLMLKPENLPVTLKNRITAGRQADPIGSLFSLLRKYINKAIYSDFAPLYDYSEFAEGNISKTYIKDYVKYASKYIERISYCVHALRLLCFLTTSPMAGRPQYYRVYQGARYSLDRWDHLNSGGKAIVYDFEIISAHEASSLPKMDVTLSNTLRKYVKYSDVLDKKYKLAGDLENKIANEPYLTAIPYVRSIMDRDRSMDDVLDPEPVEKVDEEFAYYVMLLETLRATKGLRLRRFSLFSSTVGFVLHLFFQAVGFDPNNKLYRFQTNRGPVGNYSKVDTMRLFATNDESGDVARIMVNQRGMEKLMKLEQKSFSNGTNTLSELYDTRSDALRDITIDDSTLYGLFHIDAKSNIVLLGYQSELIEASKDFYNYCMTLKSATKWLVYDGLLNDAGMLNYAYSQYTNNPQNNTRVPSGIAVFRIIDEVGNAVRSSFTQTYLKMSNRLVSKMVVMTPQVQPSMPDVVTSNDGAIEAAPMGANGDGDGTTMSSVPGAYDDNQLTVENGEGDFYGDGDENAGMLSENENENETENGDGVPASEQVDGDGGDGFVSEDFDGATDEKKELDDNVSSKYEALDMIGANFFSRDAYNERKTRAEFLKLKKRYRKKYTDEGYKLGYNDASRGTTSYNVNRKGIELYKFLWFENIPAFVISTLYLPNMRNTTVVEAGKRAEDVSSQLSIGGVQMYFESLRDNSAFLDIYNASKNLDRDTNIQNLLENSAAKELDVDQLAKFKTKYTNLPLEARQVAWANLRAEKFRRWWFVAAASWKTWRVFYLMNMIHRIERTVSNQGMSEIFANPLSLSSEKANRRISGGKFFNERKYPHPSFMLYVGTLYRKLLEKKGYLYGDTKYGLNAMKPQERVNIRNYFFNFKKRYGPQGNAGLTQYIMRSIKLYDWVRTNLMPFLYMLLKKFEDDVTPNGQKLDTDVLRAVRPNGPSRLTPAQMAAEPGDLDGTDPDLTRRAFRDEDELVQFNGDDASLNELAQDNGDTDVGVELNERSGREEMSNVGSRFGNVLHARTRTDTIRSVEPDGDVSHTTATITTTDAQLARQLDRPNGTANVLKTLLNRKTLGNTGVRTGGGAGGATNALAPGVKSDAEIEKSYRELSIEEDGDEKDLYGTPAQNTLVGTAAFIVEKQRRKFGSYASASEIIPKGRPLFGPLPELIYGDRLSANNPVIEKAFVDDFLASINIIIYEAKVASKAALRQFDDSRSKDAIFAKEDDMRREWKEERKGERMYTNVGGRYGGKEEKDEEEEETVAKSPSSGVTDGSIVAAKGECEKKTNVGANASVKNAVPDVNEDDDERMFMDSDESNDGDMDSSDSLNENAAIGPKLNWTGTKKRIKAATGMKRGTSTSTNLGTPVTKRLDACATKSVKEFPRGPIENNDPKKNIILVNEASKKLALTLYCAIQTLSKSYDFESKVTVTKGFSSEQKSMKTVFKTMFGNNLIKTPAKPESSNAFVDRIYDTLAYPLSIESSYKSDPTGVSEIADWRANFLAFDAKDRFKWLLSNCTFVVTLEPVHAGPKESGLGWNLREVKNFHYALKFADENVSIVFNKDIQKVFDSYTGSSVEPTNNVTYVTGAEYDVGSGSPFYKWNLGPKDDHREMTGFSDIVVSPERGPNVTATKDQKIDAHVVTIPQTSILVPTLRPDYSLSTVEPLHKKSLLFCTGGCADSIAKMNYIQYTPEDDHLNRISPLQILSAVKAEKSSLRPGLSMAVTSKVRFENQKTTIIPSKSASPSHLEYIDPKLRRYPDFDYHMNFQMEDTDLVPFGDALDGRKSKGPGNENVFNRKNVKGTFFTGIVEADHIKSKFFFPTTNEQMDINILVLLTNPMKIRDTLTSEDIQLRSVLHNAIDYQFKGNHLGKKQ